MGRHFDLCPDKWLSTGCVKEFLLDLRRNLLQPFLGAIGSILIMSDIRLELIYLVVSDSKLIVSGLKLIVSSSELIRKFLSDFSCLAQVCCSCVSRPANQSKNSVPCPVQNFGFRTRPSLFRSMQNNGRCICNLISHRSPQSPG